MIIDKKGKLFGKVSIVDLFVVLVIFVGIVGIFMTKAKLDKGDVQSDASQMLIQSSAEKDVLEIKLKLKEVRDVTRDAIVVGDTVYLVQTEKVLGVISRVESEPAVRNVETDNGIVYSAVVPERYDVTIVVETSGKEKEDGFYTDTNQKLLYGKEMEIKTSTIQSIPRIDGISVKKTAK